MRKKLSICFISPNAYGMISGNPGGFVGGAERQSAMLANWFHTNEYDVSVLTWEEGKPGDEKIDGISIIKICKSNSGLPGLRFFFPRWWRFIKALNRADADIYFHNCAEAQTGQAALWCWLKKKKFFYFVASDMDCHKKLPDLKVFRERFLYRIGIALATKIVTQTEKQKIDLKSNFSLDAKTIRMPCAGASNEQFKKHTHHKKNHILWIGRVCNVKRPDRLSEIATALPDCIIDLVGPHSFDRYSENIISQLRKIDNIKVHGRVEPKNVDGFYKDAAVLLCTSDFEGFPNTFLEAWSYGIPTISMFDPDSLIQKYNLGFYSRAVFDIVSAIRNLLNDTDLYYKLTANAREYFLKNHIIDVVLPQIEDLFIKSSKI